MNLMRTGQKLTSVFAKTKQETCRYVRGLFNTIDIFVNLLLAVSYAPGRESTGFYLEDEIGRINMRIVTNNLYLVVL